MSDLERYRKPGELSVPAKGHELVIPAPPRDLITYAVPKNRFMYKFLIRPGNIIRQSQPYLVFDCRGGYGDVPNVTLVSPVGGEAVRVGSKLWEFFGTYGTDINATEWDGHFTQYNSSMKDYDDTFSVVVRSPQSSIDSYIQKQNERLVYEGCLRAKANCEKALQAAPFWNFSLKKRLKEVIAEWPVR